MEQVQELDELDKIEVYGEPLKEILEQVPRWFYRWGSAIIFLILASLSLLTLVIEYPDIVSAQVYITSENPPIALVAKVDGKLTDLWVKSNESVKEGQVLGIIENTASYPDVVKLKALIDSLAIDKSISLSNHLQLGTIQSSYSSFKEVQQEYLLQLALNPELRELAEVNNQMQRQRDLIAHQKSQEELFRSELALIVKDHERLEKLHKKEVITQQALEDSKKMLLENQRRLITIKETIVGSKITTARLEREKKMLTITNAQVVNQLTLRMQKSFENLVNALSNWEQNYLLASPIEGKVTFLDFWAKNQSLKAGEEVFTIIPHDSKKIIGKVKMPVQNSGKVAVGNRVIIKLNNYPYTEFGTLTGNVRIISLLPKDGYYFLQIELPQGLTTNAGVALPIRQKMEGSAEIVTEDLKLISRIFYQFKGLF